MKLSINGITADITPYYDFDGGFTSKPTTAASAPITIKFDQLVSNISVAVNDPDFSGNSVTALDSNNNVIETKEILDVDNTPGVLTQQIVKIETLTPRIKTVVLNPAPGDFVYYNITGLSRLPDPLSKDISVPIPTVQKNRVNVPIFVQITSKVPATKIACLVEVDIFPAQTPQQTKNIEYKFNVKSNPIQINISEPIIQTANQFLEDIINVYIDEDRELKTLLNYGEDKQSVVLSYRKGPVDINGIETIQLKLLQPVPDDITVNGSVFLSREIAKTVIDNVRVRFTPELDVTPYLRPKNLKANVNLDTGKFARNVTLNKLSLQSGYVGRTDLQKNKTYEDEIFRQWYSYDFNSSELNIDFTNYENFIFYSSAAMRLAAFKEKVEQLEKLENLRKQIITPYTENTASAGFIYVQEKSEEYALQKEDIIRSFDRYEQYLHFTSGSISAYSASFDYVDGGTEYNPLGYWPKSGSGLWPASSEIALGWYETQSLIAQRFDEFNENNLINTIPTHVRDDHDNGAYITFVAMIGQLFDNIKLYIDQLPNIHSRNLDPNTELSKDLINEIAESIGFVLPTIDSVYDLTDNILGKGDNIPRRDLTAEIYKRLLHNVPFFAKAKGTKTALDSLLSTFGITQPLLSVKETGTPNTSSYKVVTEYSTGLDFDKEKISYIRLPVSASNRETNLLQFNFTVAKNETMTILTGDDKWALNVVRHPTNDSLGRFQIISGSTNVVVASSSYYPVFGDELLNIAIKTYANTSSLYFAYVDGDDVIYNQIINTTSTFPATWYSTNYVYLGGSGSKVTSRYDGTLDEIRLWGIPISTETILNTAYNPSSNAGEIYSDASDYLYAQLSFNKVNSTSLAANFIENESPYKNKTVSPSLETFAIYNINESDFTRYSRTIKQDIPTVGTSTQVSNKVVVVPPPRFINDSNGLRLYRNKSIVRPADKKFNKGKNTVILAMTPSDIINTNIINNFGLENINDILGIPTELYRPTGNTLKDLQEHYKKYYYVDVDRNNFIRVMSDLSSVLNQIVDYFIPAKANLLKGVVIDSDILQQVKIKPLKKLRFYGKETRRTLNAPGSLTGSKSDYGATFNVGATLQWALTSSGTENTYRTIINEDISQEISGTHVKYDGILKDTEAQILAKHNKYSGSIQAADVSNVVVQYSKLTSSLMTKNDIDISATNNTFATQHQLWNYSGIDKPATIESTLDIVNKVPYDAVNRGSPGAEPFNRVYTRKLFDTEISAIRSAGSTSLYVPALYSIPPSTDFTDFGVRTYFNSDESIYYFNETKLTPAYPEPLNATWNFGEQSFGNTITTWSYGEEYNKLDVVYQDLSTPEINELNLPRGTPVRGGNRRYYVFKQRPAYSAPVSDTSYYLGSVPSFLPPSLDRENWDVLRFKPVQVRVPKRVVFDTYRINNPALNNFKTTTIDVETNITIPTRFIDTYDIVSIPSNGRVVGDLLVQNIAVLFAAQISTTNLRLRLYRTSEARNNDLERSIETRPVNSHGVLVDVILNGINTPEIFNPMTSILTGDTSPSGKIYYTIDNLDPVAKLKVTLLLYYFAIEIQPRVPTDYLRKHYRFFRDNSTALKRRNYVGCKNTVETTVDGLPPIQVFISTGTELQVGSGTLNQEIITGGGGTLNVT